MTDKREPATKNALLRPACGCTPLYVDQDPRTKFVWCPKHAWTPVEGRSES